MTEKTAIRDLLGALKDSSIAAHREVEQTLADITPHGDAVTLAWLTACRALFDFDREAGRAFIRGSAEAERVSETVLPWTEQALRFMTWRGSWRALEGFMVNERRPGATALSRISTTPSGWLANTCRK